MKKKGKRRQVLSAMLAVLTTLSAVITPLAANAAIDGSMNVKPPHYEEVKDLLDEDEVVIASDYEMDYGYSFDLKKDFSNIQIPNPDKVKVTFVEAKNKGGDDFSSACADTYKAVYYVQPLTTDHPKYQISRNLIVREEKKEAEAEAKKEADAEVISESDGETKANADVIVDAAAADSQKPATDTTISGSETADAETTGTETADAEVSDEETADQETMDEDSQNSDAEADTETADTETADTETVDVTD